MKLELSAPRRPDGRSKTSTWTVRGISAVAGSVIAGLLIASPAAADAAAPVPPNTTDSAVAAPAAAGLGESVKKTEQKIVRAVVRSDATLVSEQSYGAASATRVDGSPVGTYQVCFDVEVTNGTYNASVGIPGNRGASQPGEVTVVGRVTTDNCLFIQTFDSAGVLADRGFHVTVVYSQER